jgi:endothelin-converting enzyme/putative endopeptidase
MLLLVCFSSLAAYAQKSDSGDRPYDALPYSPSLDVAAMDPTVNPCEDLYTYSCGGWQAKNPIPSDQASWSVYAKLYADNQRYLWGILQHAAEPRADRSAREQKIGDYFAACMDTAAIDRRGATPLQSDLQLIDALTSKDQLPRVLADLHSHIEGAPLLFGVGSGQDARDATRVIAWIGSGGLGLPDRDYYTKGDARSKEIRARYGAHVAHLLELLGESQPVATRHATTAMRMETALARATLTQVDKRDPYKIYHRTSLQKLRASTPAFDWSVYLSTAQIETHPWLSVSEPLFLRAMNDLIMRSSLDDLKTYLRAALVNEQARYLSSRFVDEDFAFRQKFLLGVESQRPRWKKCVALVDRDLGEALGQEFIARTFPNEIKAQTLRMTEQIRTAMKERIEQLAWMTPQTKVQALAKLVAIRENIAYPELWRDYGVLPVARNDFYSNVAHAQRFESERQLAKIGKPVDRDEWSMTPPTVNAYYDQQLNGINFPAGVLLPPLYDPKMDDAPNYGDTGGTIGHELTHAFDDAGRKYDKDGNLRDWWTPQDAKEFEGRAQCVRDQYAQYTVVDDIKVNSGLSSGEDIADLGGLIIAWMAWQEQTKHMQLEAKDGLTPQQRFFVGFAQWSCTNDRPESLRASAIVSPHSPPKYRVNGVVENMPEFARAFSCKPSDALVKKAQEICRVW